MNENMALLIVFESPKTLYDKIKANIKGLSIDNEGVVKMIVVIW